MATLKTNSALRCTGIPLTIAVATTMAAILPARPAHAVSPDDLPGVEVPAGWVLSPQGKSPFQVMVPFILDEFAKPEGSADNNLSSFLDTLPDTKIYSSFYTARKGEAAGADALKDSADLMQREALRHSLTLYGGSGVAWMALDPDAYQALETCVHSRTNDPNGRKTCLEELKAGSDTFIETWTGAWGKDKWIFDKYFSSTAASLVRAYAVDWKHKSLGNWEYQAPPELSVRLATLQTNLIEPIVATDCDKSPIPSEIK